MDTITIDGRELPMPEWKDGIMYPSISDISDEWWPKYDEDSDSWTRVYYLMEWDEKHGGWIVGRGDECGWDGYECSFDEWDRTYQDYADAWDEYYAWVAESGEDPLDEFFVLPRVVPGRIWTLQIVRRIGCIQLVLDSPMQNGRFRAPSEIMGFLCSNTLTGEIFQSNIFQVPPGTPPQEVAAELERSWLAAARAQEARNFAYTDRDHITITVGDGNRITVQEFVTDDSDAKERIREAARRAISSDKR